MIRPTPQAGSAGWPTSRSSLVAPRALTSRSTSAPERGSCQQMGSRSTAPDSSTGAPVSPNEVLATAATLAPGAIALVSSSKAASTQRRSSSADSSTSRLDRVTGVARRLEASTDPSSARTATALTALVPMSTPTRQAHLVTLALLGSPRPYCASTAHHGPDVAPVERIRTPTLDHNSSTCASIRPPYRWRDRLFPESELLGQVSHHRKK